MIRRITFDREEALYSLESTRHSEHLTAASLPPHTLMARAGLAIARLSRAVQPHARRIWVACGPGNNGGDGLVAATHLHQWAKSTGNGVCVIATHASAGPAFRKVLPPDAQNALAAARKSGVPIQFEPPAQFDLGIDALLGMGASGPLSGVISQTLGHLRHTSSPVLCVDLPSGLHAETGDLQPLQDEPASATLLPPGPRYTLSLLTLKPGLFTKDGRDASGDIWFDDLSAAPLPHTPPMAWLHAEAPPTILQPLRRHGSHKGKFGDVLVLGGQSIAVSGVGMTGAAILAATAALHAGAGRVFVSLLGEQPGSDIRYDPLSPELMFRALWRMLESDLPDSATVVCGCGGGDAVATTLPSVLTRSPRLVLDADALNAIAKDPALRAQLTQRSQHGWTTVLTPHPLEAARLMETSTVSVMQDRLTAAQTLADQFGAICVLKGSGTIVAQPGEAPWINASGNGRLATAGTGDVLAGMIGAALAAPQGFPARGARHIVASAVYQHGALADSWTKTGGPGETAATLTASELARRVRPFS